ncbi:alpha/beta-hydrolase [Cylindrobasidium torrendii FP15055 ss-10]|uniref:Alpha/beta-hydrolase n=1 Tax=Cylindrobasidium torrendii FP15055 ss-10 TaxID=1314674 RepID=A0A0D7BNY2_9AGAR|nr:alpha/beta-hydrolase [Cylindrobasidium torrendii FP15055 ss-10]
MFDQTDRAYASEQGTKPQTIGYSLTDSPVGLLAWIYEKLVSWTDDYAWTDDEVLTWIAIYLFSRAGPAAACRTYYEYMKHTKPRTEGKWYTSIPSGISYFPKEIQSTPRIFQRVNANLMFEAEHDKGGYFAATEQPGFLEGDLRKLFGKGGPAFGVVKGKTGY